jgi:hypothetical protein
MIAPWRFRWQGNRARGYQNAREKGIKMRQNGIKFSSRNKENINAVTTS